MNDIVRITTIVSFVFLAASATAATPPRTQYFPDLSCDGGRFGLNLPKTPQDLRKIGVLQKEKVLAETSWDDYKTQERELQFHGLVLVVITFTNDESRFMVVRTTITSPEWTFAGGFQVGQTITTVLQRLNIKDSPSQSGIRFAGDTDSVGLRFSDGRLVRIHYECYTG
jgi:hypothetical protein